MKLKHVTPKTAEPIIMRLEESLVKHKDEQCPTVVLTMTTNEVIFKCNVLFTFYINNLPTPTPNQSSAVL